MTESTMVFTGATERLIKEGYDALSLYDRNQLIIEFSVANNLKISSVTREHLFQYHKDLKTEFFKNLCDEQILLGFESPTTGNFYRTNRDDQINLIGQKDVLASDPTIEYVDWKTENKGYVRHTKEDWLRVYLEGFLHKRDTIMQYNILKHKIEAAVNDDEIVKLKWTYKITDKEDVISPPIVEGENQPPTQPDPEKEPVEVIIPEDEVEVPKEEVEVEVEDVTPEDDEDEVESDIDEGNEPQ